MASRPKISRDEFQKRVSRLRQSLEKQNLDGMLAGLFSSNFYDHERHESTRKKRICSSFITIPSQYFVPFRAFRG